MIAATSDLPLPATRYPGVGPRAVATVIDAVVGSFVIGLPLLLAFGKTTTARGPNGGRTTTHSTNDPKVLLLWLALGIGYYVAFETTIGATPGKLLLGLRVRSGSGEKITVREALIRNVFRVVDAFPYFVPYLAGAIAVWNDGKSSFDPLPAERRRRRRVGDRAAGTIVTYR